MKLHPKNLIIVLVFCVALAFPCLHALANSVAGFNDENPNGIPVGSSLPFLQNISYTSENDLKSDSLVIPLKRAGRLLLIEAMVDNEPGNLVFDTGASGLVFNSTYFRNHAKSGGGTSNGITGGVGSIEQITIERMEFAGLSYKNIRVDITNLGHIENRRGIKILGLIGFNMFRNFEILIDAKNNQLKLFRIDKTGNRISTDQSKFRSDHTQKIAVNSNIVFLEGRVAGKNLTFCFDTGAETNVISSYSNKNILNTLTITRRSGLRGTGASKAEVLFGRMNDFILGNRQIHGMETIVSNLDELSEAYGTKIDGMLGYNFMEQGILCINFTKKQFGIQFTKGEEK
jgi:hypothetical protein